MSNSHCKRCGKKLTDPVSIAMGIGPECRNKRFQARCRRILKSHAVINKLPVSVGKTMFSYSSGGWIEENREDAKAIEHERFMEWLLRYGVISQKSLEDAEKLKNIDFAKQV